MSLAYDTLAVAKNLESAGFERSHAEAIADAIRGRDNELATKNDIRNLEIRMDALEDKMNENLANIREFIRAENEKLRTEMARRETRGLGFVAAMLALTIAILQFLP